MLVELEAFLVFDAFAIGLPLEADFEPQYFLDIVLFDFDFGLAHQAQGCEPRPLAQWLVVTGFPEMAPFVLLA